MVLSKYNVAAAMAVLFFVALLPSTVLADIYVNNGQGSNCRDSYSRQEAMDSSKPFCTLEAAFNKAESGDTITVADGVYRKVNGTVFSGKNFAERVTMQASGNNAIITSSNSEVAWSRNAWTKEDGSGNVWRTTQIKADGVSVGCYYMNNFEPLFPYNDQNQFYDSSMPEGTYWNDGADVLKVRLSGTKNPNDEILECSYAETLRINNVNNFKMQDFIIRGGSKLLRLEGSNQIIITNNRFYGGLSDTGAIDVRDGDSYSIRYNTIQRKQPTTWWWELAKYGVNTETSAIWMKDSGSNPEIEHNTIEGYFNGIVLYTETTGKFRNAKIRFNTLSDLYDDAIELERYAYGYNITQNDISNYYVAFSLAPADSSQARSYIKYNTLQNARTIQFTRSTTSRGITLKTSGTTPLNFDLLLDNTPLPTTPSPTQTSLVLSNKAPSGTLSSGTTSVTLTLTSNEPAICKYSRTNGTSYTSMTDNFGSTPATSHSRTVTGLTSGRTYYFHVRCADNNGLYTTRDYTISFTIPSPQNTSTPPADITAPTRTNARPAGTLSSSTTSTTISINTNEASTCKYSTQSGTSYSSMPSTFSTTGGTSHSKTITGLQAGRSYTYNVRCRDSSGNENTNDYQVRFSIEQAPVPEPTPEPEQPTTTPSRSGGGGGGGGGSSSSTTTQTPTQTVVESTPQPSVINQVVCGDNVCSDQEDCSSCQDDCGFCQQAEEQETLLSPSDSPIEMENSVVKASQPRLSAAIQPNLALSPLENNAEPEKTTFQEVPSNIQQVKDAGNSKSGMSSWLILTLITVSLIVLCLYNTEISVFTGKKNKIRIVVRNKNFSKLHEQIKNNLSKSSRSALVTADQLYSAYPDYAQKLTEYIKANRIVGVSDRKTKTILVSEGWPEDIVKAVLKSTPREK